MEHWAITRRGSAHTTFAKGTERVARAHELVAWQRQEQQQQQQPIAGRTASSEPLSSDQPRFVTYSLLLRMVAGEARGGRGEERACVKRSHNQTNQYPHLGGGPSGATATSPPCIRGTVESLIMDNERCSMVASSAAGVPNFRLS